MRVALTNKGLDALKSKTDRYEVQDTVCPGLSVRVTPEGRKTFNVKYRYGLKQKRMSLGVYPRISLSEARDRAREAMRHVDEGSDPAKRRRQPEFRVEAVVKEFIERYAKPRNRKWMESERILWRELVAVFGQRDIREIRREHIIEIMDGAVDRGAHYQANRILANVRKLFNWCIERGIVETSPTNGLKAPTKEVARDRRLSDAEIVALLRACRNDVYPFRQFVPLLLATGQRRGELANMRWSEIDFTQKTWTIPAERSKNGKAHFVPLSAYALELLAEVPRFLDCDYVFTTKRTSPVSGFSKALRRLWLATGADDWRYHDLRRTAASGMAQARVQPHVIEKVLNHMSGKISGVAAVYNRYEYADEMRAALEDWGAYLERLSDKAAASL
ncbi:MAG: tyrosine-type recombinase/integrase [Sphingomonas sp.]|uniref:tyrosine-type recombinase/integrase n=1 Tax=Sphingomonas sp. TaxID=28214 RepID=UPI0025FB1939|nr:site-specific integrase [Sphingomonas sp.]MBX3564835.1 tyrosine-type recombinase/integrase [Sphingomonas sp.]